MYQSPAMPQRGGPHLPHLPFPHRRQPADSPQPAGLAPPLQPPASASAPLPPGSILLHRYFIEGYIGGGGFAHIYRARDMTFRQRRAIKEAFYHDAPTREQFRLEAEFLINTHHPNLVRGYTYFEHASRMYLVMEYVDGQTLEDIAIDHIRRTHQALPEWLVLDWMIPICDAVHALHLQPAPIIHRDIKPANIKLSREKGIPILIDLGLAKLYREGMPTVAAALAFTPGYAPPEQYHAAGRTDQRTDVYALGATLYFLLTGYQPTESPARLTIQRLPDPRQLNPNLSPEIEAVVLRAMALNADVRQQSALELAAGLRAARATLAVPVAAARADSGGAVASGGQVAMRACSRCGAGNPAPARFCMQCGGPLTLDASRPLQGAAGETSGGLGFGMAAWDAESGAAAPAFAGRPAAPVIVATPRGAAPALSPALAEWSSGVRPIVAAPSPAGPGVEPWAIPTPPHAQALVFAAGGVPLAYGEGRERAHQVEVEAAASILALLALVCLTLSLMGAFLTPMLVFAVVALALGHWVVGSPWQPGSSDERSRERPKWLRWLLWPGMPMPQEFKMIAIVSLVAAYLWLIAIVAQMVWSAAH